MVTVKRPKLDFNGTVMNIYESSLSRNQQSYIHKRHVVEYRIELYIKKKRDNPITIEAKKRPVLDITRSFFRMSTQVKSEVRKDFNWLDYMSNTVGSLPPVLSSCLSFFFFSVMCIFSVFFRRSVSSAKCCQNPFLISTSGYSNV